MSDYASRNEGMPIERTGVRPTAVQPVSALAKAADKVTRAGQVPPVAEQDVAAIDDNVAGAAEYAKVHARITMILADMRSDTPPSVDAASQAVQSMLPERSVIVPLPPASKEAVEQAASLARRLVQQSFYAHAAQAHVKRGTVDQLLSPAH